MRALVRSLHTVRILTEMRGMGEQSRQEIRSQYGVDIGDGDLRDDLARMTYACRRCGKPLASAAANHDHMRDKHGFTSPEEGAVQGHAHSSSARLTNLNPHLSPVAMKLRAIPFSKPMVQALRAGTKTQTRRVATLTANGHVKEPRGHRRWHPDDPDAVLASPYGQPGDGLYVREAWRTVTQADHLPPRHLNEAHRLWYEADAPHQPGFGRYRHARFMPRWASRLYLEIVKVRLERLQSICAADAIAEGIEPLGEGWQRYHVDPDAPVGQPFTRNPVLAYRGLWEQINGAGSWADNPLVWVIEFRRIDRAILQGL